MDRQEIVRTISSNTVGALGMIGGVFILNRSQEKKLRRINSITATALASAVRIRDVLPAFIKADEQRSIARPSSDNKGEPPTTLGAVAKDVTNIFSIKSIVMGTLLALPMLMSDEIKEKVKGFFLGILVDMGVPTRKMAGIAVGMKYAAMALTAAFAFKKLLQIYSVAKHIVQAIEIVKAMFIVLSGTELINKALNKPSTIPGSEHHERDEKRKQKLGTLSRGHYVSPEGSKVPTITVPTTGKYTSPTSVGKSHIERQRAGRQSAAARTGVPFQQLSQGLAAKKNMAAEFNARGTIQRPPVAATAAATTTATASTLASVSSKAGAFATTLGKIMNPLAIVAGVGLDAYDAYDRFKRGDISGSAVSGTAGVLGAVGGVMLLTPLAPIGAALVGISGLTSLANVLVFDQIKDNSNLDKNAIVSGGNNLNNDSAAVSAEDASNQKSRSISVVNVTNQLNTIIPTPPVGEVVFFTGVRR